MWLMMGAEIVTRRRRIEETKRKRTPILGVKVSFLVPS